MSIIKRRNENYIIVVGCGRLGAAIASSLSADGQNVMIIDQFDDSFRKLPDSFDGMMIKGDATEMFLRKEADITKATAVIAVTNHDNTNIMVAQIANQMLDIKNVIARLYDPDRACVYEELGIKTICPVILSTDEITDILDEGGAL